MKTPNVLSTVAAGNICQPVIMDLHGVPSAGQVTVLSLGATGIQAG